MHMLSTGACKEFANIDGACALCGGSARGKLLLSSLDIPRLQAALLFVLLATFRNFERAFAD
jgi:hypothetical protein